LFRILVNEAFACRALPPEARSRATRALVANPEGVKSF
jgi:hypothetical protein